MSVDETRIKLSIGTEGEELLSSLEAKLESIQNDIEKLNSASLDKFKKSISDIQKISKKIEPIDITGSNFNRQEKKISSLEDIYSKVKDQFNEIPDGALDDVTKSLYNNEIEKFERVITDFKSKIHNFESTVADYKNLIREMQDYELKDFLNSDESFLSNRRKRYVLSRAGSAAGALEQMDPNNIFDTKDIIEAGRALQKELQPILDMFSNNVFDDSAFEKMRSFLQGIGVDADNLKVKLQNVFNAANNTQAPTQNNTNSARQKRVKNSGKQNQNNTSNSSQSSKAPFNPTIPSPNNKRIVNKQGKSSSLNYEKLFLGDNQDIDYSIKDKILKRIEKDFSSNGEGINIDSIQTTILNSADGMEMLETTTKGFNEQMTRAYKLVSNFDLETGNLYKTGILSVTDTTARQRRKALEAQKKQAEKEAQKSQKEIDSDYLSHVGQIISAKNKKANNDAKYDYVSSDEQKQIDIENESLEKNIQLHETRMKRLNASNEAVQKGEKRLKQSEGERYINSTASGKTAKLKSEEQQEKKKQSEVNQDYINSIKDQIKYENMLAEAEKNRDKSVGDKKNQYAEQVEMFEKLIAYEKKYRENLKASDDIIQRQTDIYKRESDKREIRKGNSSDNTQKKPGENFTNTLLSKFDEKEIENLSSATGKIESYKAAVQEAKDKYKELVDFVNRNDMSSKDNQTEANKLAKSVKSSIDELKSESYDAFNTKGSFLKSYTGNLEEVRSELVKLVSSYEGVDEASLKWSANQKSLTYLMEDSSGQIKKYRVNLEKLGEGYNIRTVDLGKQTGFDKLGDLIDNGISGAKNGIVGVIDMYASIQDLINYARDGINVFKEYDAALTDISYTTEGTKAQIDAIGDSYVQLAKDMSTSVDASMEVASIYANLQTSTEEVMQSVKPTLMLANATGVDAATASDQIQGILEQFDISTENAEHVVDVLENVSSNLKEDFGKAITNVTEGVSAVGQTAADAGFSFEQLAAMIGKVSEKTRDSGSEIGNSLKTMLTRISKASSLTDEVDNETISKAAKSLHEVGVEVYQQDGTFRNFLTILSELRDKWNGLSDAQQADEFAWVFGNKYQRIYLIAGNALESCTTIIGKPDYEGLKTQELAVHAAKLLSVA